MVMGRAMEKKNNTTVSTGARVDSTKVTGRLNAPTQAYTIGAHLDRHPHCTADAGKIHSGDKRGTPQYAVPDTAQRAARSIYQRTLGSLAKVPVDEHLGGRVAGLTTDGACPAALAIRRGRQRRGSVSDGGLACNGSQRERGRRHRPLRGHPAKYDGPDRAVLVVGRRVPHVGLGCLKKEVCFHPSATIEVLLNCHNYEPILGSGAVGVKRGSLLPTRTRAVRLCHRSWGIASLHHCLVLCHSHRHCHRRHTLAIEAGSGEQRSTASLKDERSWRPGITSRWAARTWGRLRLAMASTH